MQIEDMIPRGAHSIKELFARLEELHKPISRYFVSGIANELMAIEARIAERVMLRLLDEGVVALPVHDSFLVRKGDQDLLRSAMCESFRKLAGGPASVEDDKTELDLARQELGRDEWDVLEVHEYQEHIEKEREQQSIYWSLRKDWESTQARNAEDSNRTEISQQAQIGSPPFVGRFAVEANPVTSIVSAVSA
jgi:hypothetical protein